ncbi:hypothetical protein BDP27DRAFT_1366242 [Rhodocollybia butyracea]|uniref:Uncharacterized protein n=1 Tax=Rhodocollybia butyracea TaxID=206335 RepID=A0A9P5U5C5_9AGAR|nr:hypothetical protein BDP27DRAFT_1366242 [Rhodocollybia butyracea]
MPPSTSDLANLDAGVDVINPAPVAVVKDLASSYSRAENGYKGISGLGIHQAHRISPINRNSKTRFSLSSYGTGLFRIRTPFSIDISTPFFFEKHYVATLLPNVSSNISNHPLSYQDILLKHYLLCLIIMPIMELAFTKETAFMVFIWFLSSQI